MLPEITVCRYIYEMETVICMPPHKSRTILCPDLRYFRSRRIRKTIIGDVPTAQFAKQILLEIIA
jgi:hypothetical protein